MKVTNAWDVPNQVVIVDDDDNEWFSSYGVMVAKIEHNGQTYLDQRYWNYSKTTSKYLLKFLGFSSEKLKFSIKNNEVILTDLNEKK